MASLGRWNAVDPLAEKYLSYSGYNYVLGNPLKFIDPDGRSVDTAWIPTRQWEISDFQDFQDFQDIEIKAMEKSKEEFDCADLAMALLCRYASKEGLEINITLARGDVANSTTDNSTSPEEFEEKVKDYANAESILNDMVSVADPVVSDLTNNGFHVNILTKLEKDVIYSEGVYPGVCSTSSDSASGGTIPRRIGIIKNRKEDDGFKRWYLLNKIKAN